MESHIRRINVKNKPPKKIKRVEVEWFDSCQEHQVWWWIDEIIKENTESKETFKSVGYLLYKDKNKTIIATSLHFGKDGEIEKAGTIFTIPTGSIKNIKYL